MAVSERTMSIDPNLLLRTSVLISLAAPVVEARREVIKCDCSANSGVEVRL